MPRPTHAVYKAIKGFLLIIIASDNLSSYSSQQSLTLHNSKEERKVDIYLKTLSLWNKRDMTWHKKNLSAHLKNCIMSENSRKLQFAIVLQDVILLLTV
jgi:hypothetical protein